MRKVFSFALTLCLLTMIFVTVSTTVAVPLDDFTAGTAYNGTDDFNYIAVANFNGDSYDDFIIGAGGYPSPSNHGIHARISNGDGTWTFYDVTTTGNYAGISIADADGDNNLEVYAGYEKWGGSSPSGVDVFEWNGAGFDVSDVPSPDSTGDVGHIIVEDISGDSDLDAMVATQDGGIHYYEGDNTATYTWTEKSSNLPSSGECTFAEMVDVNKDGMLDVAFGRYSGGGFHLYTQNATSPEWTDRDYSLPSALSSVTTYGIGSGDVNNDGNQDLIVTVRNSGMRTLLGNGGGGSGWDIQWTEPTPGTSGFPSNFGSSGTFAQVELADIDKDGDLDLLVAEESGGLHLFYGNGSDSPGNNFEWTKCEWDLATSGTYYAANFLDFDGDNDLDIVGGTWGGGYRFWETNLLLSDYPNAHAGSDQTIINGSTVYLDGTNSSDAQDAPGKDLMGTILTYDWNFTSVPSGSAITDASLSPNDADAKASFTPDMEGVYNLSLVVQDTDSNWALTEDFVEITVTALNTNPTAHAGDDQEVYTGATVTLNGTLSSDNEDSFGLLTFDWNVTAGNPAAVTLSDESAAKPTFTAPDTVGDYFFSLVIRDSLGAWSTEDDVKITVVLPPNVAPVADAGQDFSGFSNTTLALGGNASDTDGLIEVWDWNCTSHPSVVITDENTSTPEFTPDAPGMYVFTLRVRDDRYGWSLEDVVNVTVLEANTPPTVNAGEDFTAYFEEETLLNGTLSSDKEGFIMTWDWKCTSHPTLTLSDVNSSTPSFTPDAVTIYVFTLTVMDDLGDWSGTDTVNVTVKERVKNKLPTANAGKDQEKDVNSTVTLDGSLSEDLDGSIEHWDWNCTSHPSLEFTDEDSSSPTFTPTELGKYVITLRVQDDIGDWSLEDEVTITVVPEGTGTGTKNTPPTIRITTPKDGAVIGNTTSIAWVSSDEDGDTLSFKVELLDSTDTLVKVLGESLTISDNPFDFNTTVETNGEYKIRVTVSDGTDEVSDTTEVFTISNTSPEKTDDDDDKTVFGSGGLIFAIIGAVVFLLVIIIIIVLVVVVAMKKKEPAQAPPPEVEEPTSLMEESQPFQEESQEPQLQSVQSPYADAQTGQPGWETTEQQPEFGQSLDAGDQGLEQPEQPAQIDQNPQEELPPGPEEMGMDQMPEQPVEEQTAPEMQPEEPAAPEMQPMEPETPEAGAQPDENTGENFGFDA